MTTPAQAPNLHPVTGPTQGTSRTGPLATLIAAVLLVAAAGGFAIGYSNRHTGDQAAAARHHGRLVAQRGATRQAAAAARPHGLHVGTALGRAAGRRAGNRRGHTQGARQAQAQASSSPPSAGATTSATSSKGAPASAANSPAPSGCTTDPDKVTAGAEQCLGPGSTGKPCPPGSIPNADGGVVCVKP